MRRIGISLFTLLFLGCAPCPAVEDSHERNNAVLWYTETEESLTEIELVAVGDGHDYVVASNGNYSGLAVLHAAGCRHASHQANTE